MKIINPLYDVAFKYLMQNNRIAKKVISTLLECEVMELVIEQQEIVTVDGARGLKLYRLDFSAIILTPEGTKQKVLIELQKSKLPANLLRFRTYLGNSYIKRDVFKDKFGNEQERAYPIISIYILGYNVKDIPYLAVSIDNKITDTVTKKEVSLESDFVALLTHQTRIIQIRRLSDKRKSRLEQFLTIFNQAWVTSDNYILELQEIPEGFQDVVNHLGKPVHDEAFRQRLSGEKEIDDIFKNQEAALARAEEALKTSKEQEAKAKQEALEAKTSLSNVVRHLLKIDTPIEQIIQITGLTKEAIETIKKA